MCSAKILYVYLKKRKIPAFLLNGTIEALKWKPQKYAAKRVELFSSEIPRRTHKQTLFIKMGK